MNESSNRPKIVIRPATKEKWEQDQKIKKRAQALVNLIERHRKEREIKSGAFQEHSEKEG